MADVDDLAEELRAPEGDPAGAIVLLHGRGTSEQDLLPLLDVLDPRERLVGAFPRGPLQLPPIGYHWYVVEEVGYPDPRASRRPTSGSAPGWKVWANAPASGSSGP